jgi:hypothetical protein
VGVTYKTGSGLDDWIYWHLMHTPREYRQYSAIVDLHTLQSTVTHYGSQFSLAVSWQRIYKYHCHLKPHMKSLFAVKFLSCHYSATVNSEDSTQFSSSAPKLISWRVGVPKLDSTLLSLSLMLRPTVSRPVCLGIKHPFGLTTRFLLPYGIWNTSDSCGFVCMGRSL